MSMVNRSQRSRFSLQFVARGCRLKGQEKYLELNNQGKGVREEMGSLKRSWTGSLENAHCCNTDLSQFREETGNLEIWGIWDKQQ